MKSLLVFVTLLGLQTSAWSQTEYAVSYDAMVANETQYKTTLANMRRDLAGTTPKKFFVDGVEYHGNYFKSGNNTDVFKVYENGKPVALRLPNLSRVLRDINVYHEFVSGIQIAQKHGINTVQILDAGAPNKLAVKVEFLENFETVRDFMNGAVKDPQNPVVRQKIDALKSFAQNHGMKRMPDFKPDNMGFELKNGKYQIKVIDTHTPTPGLDDYKPTRYSESSLGKGFEDMKQSQMARGKQDPMNPGRAPFRKLPTYSNFEAIEREVMSSAYPGKSPVTAGLGTGLNVMSFAGVLLPLFFPEFNPFAGPAIGVSCSQAHANLNRLRCEWDVKINPLNNIVYCTRVKSVQSTGKKQFFTRLMKSDEVCTVVYDAFGFRVDDSQSRATLKNQGYFNKPGIQTQSNRPQDILKEIGSKVKITEPTYEENRTVPESNHSQEWS